MASQLVLVVDDEPNIVQLIRLYLEREGFLVHSVGGAGPPYRQPQISNRR